MHSISGDLRERLELEIRKSFSVDELREILLTRLDRDLSDIVIPETRIAAVFKLMNAAVRQGWMTDLLQELRRKRPGPEKANLRRLIDEALGRQSEPPEDNFFGAEERALAPCKHCWWRSASHGGLQALAHGLTQSAEEIVEAPRLPRLDNHLPYDLSKEADFELGREIVATANSLLRTAFGEKSRARPILERFERADAEDNWAAALVDASRGGGRSLVALFLAMFMISGRLRSLADSNLRNLYKRNVPGGLDAP